MEKLTDEETRAIATIATPLVMRVIELINASPLEPVDRLAVVAMLFEYYGQRSGKRPGACVATLVHGMAGGSLPAASAVIVDALRELGAEVIHEAEHE